MTKIHESGLEVIIMSKKKQYDIKKGLNKFGVNAIIVILSGLIVVWQNDPKYIAMIPMIKLGLNWIKHRK